MDQQQSKQQKHSTGEDARNASSHKRRLHEMRERTVLQTPITTNDTKPPRSKDRTAMVSQGLGLQYANYLWLPGQSTRSQPMARPKIAAGLQKNA